jgi:hypothetical protein
LRPAIDEAIFARFGRWGVRAFWESSILFSFETDFTGRVKADPQIETWQGRSAAAFTPAVILFTALPEGKQHRAGAIPLECLPRRCPVCHDDTIIGHGRRRRQCHDDQRECIWVRRGICEPCGKTFTILLLSKAHSAYNFYGSPLLVV